MAAQRVQCAAACCDDRGLLEACVDALPREQQDEWHRLKRKYLKSVLASRERERAAKAEYERVVREVEARKERARDCSVRCCGSSASGQRPWGRSTPPTVVPPRAGCRLGLITSWVCTGWRTASLLCMRRKLGGGGLPAAPAKTGAHQWAGSLNPVPCI